MMFFSFRKISHWPQWLAGFTVSTALIVTGIASGWTSPVIAQLTAQNSTLPLKLTNAEASWFVSLLNLGRLSGAILGPYVQGFVGRKKTLLLGGIPMAAGWICMLTANSVPLLYTARFMSGLASGTIWSGLGLFLGEIADPMIRGALIFLNCNVASVGALLGMILGSYISMETLSCVSLVGTGVFIVLFSLVPDSPYHYIAKGNITEAEKSLRWFNREADVKREIQELQDFVGCTNVSFARRFHELKKNPKHVKNLLMMQCLNFFLYFSGYNTISFYAEIIVTKSGVNITPSYVVIGLGCSSIIAGAAATVVVDKFGRRPLLMVSASVTTFSLVLLGAHFHMLSLGFDPSSLTWVPIFALFTSTFGCYCGMVPVPNALISELFPPILKTVAAMTFSVTSALMAFIVAKCFQPYADLVGEKYVFWTFALSAMSSAVFAYFFIPETKGKSLMEIQESLKKDHQKTTNAV